MHLKMASGKWRPFCLGLNVLNVQHLIKFVSVNEWARYFVWNFKGTNTEYLPIQ